MHISFKVKRSKVKGQGHHIISLFRRLVFSLLADIVRLINSHIIIIIIIIIITKAITVETDSVIYRTGRRTNVKICTPMEHAQASYLRLVKLC